MEDGQLYSAVQEALLVLIIHEEAHRETAEDGPRLFFRLCADQVHAAMSHQVSHLQALFGRRNEKTRLGELYI